MTLGMAVFFLLLATASAALIWLAFRIDKPIGWLTVLLLTVYFVGGVGIGEYLEKVRGRAYFASDEVSYLGAGEQLASDWRTGVRRTPVLPGFYPTWNALIVYLYGGGSLLPMRLVNGLIGAAAPLGGFVLARQLFGDLRTARLAALFIAVSPSLLIWSLTNLKERSIGTMVLVTVIAAVAAVKRWGILQLAAVAGSIVLLGMLRHYYAAILGWVIIIAFVVAHRATMPLKLMRGGAMLLLVGLAQYPSTGSFLATSIGGETQVDDAEAVLAGDISPAGPVAPPPQPAPGPTPAAPPSSIPTASEKTAESTSRPDVLGDTLPTALPARAATVLFGRFVPRGDTGRVASVILTPDWLMALVLTPLALVGFIRAMWQRHYEVLVPAMFVGAMLGVLSLMAVDSWAIYRFRSIYWPLLLTLAAGGAVWVLETVRRAR
jgi:hypothetical protein